MSRNKILVVTLLAALFSFLNLQAAPVNINTADASTLANSLNGVGASKAQAIIDYRENNGEFKTISDLSLVKGIGERTVLKNQDDIALTEEQLEEKYLLTAVVVTPETMILQDSK